MSMRVSQFYGRDIYSERAEYVGKVEDVILNLETAEIMRLSIRPFRANTLPPEEVKKIISEESVGYEEVIRVGDVILVKRNPAKLGRKKTAARPASSDE
jgi:sporulation protein YlmC with PRC-barrel domain